MTLRGDRMALPNPSQGQMPDKEGERAKRPMGRPRRGHEVVASHTVRLGAQAQADLTRLAKDRGRSIHSIILEGIDDVIRKLDASPSA